MKRIDGTKGMKKRHEKEDDVPLPRGLVPHPRFGARQTHLHRVAVSTAEVRARVWQTRRATLIPGTVLAANAALQNFSLYPRAFYVDMLKTCGQCDRPFVFHAAEQKHWFEVLKFYVDADCARCVECRKRAQRLRGALARYSRRTREPRLDAKDMKALVDDALLLLEQGVVRNLAVLGALKNRALREIGATSGVERLSAVLAQAHLAAAMRPGAHFGRRRPASPAEPGH